MAEHESTSITDEWYTPAWVFEALDVEFDLDPCNSAVWNPAVDWCYKSFGPPCGLDRDWFGKVWLNPPFGKRNGVRPWLEKLIEHNNGIALVPNRTATDWWQDAAEAADALLFVRGKIRFERPDGSEGGSPGYGNVLMAYGAGLARELTSSDISGLRL